MSTINNDNSKISDQAFKPAAVGQKERLESLGCQVKGCKIYTHITSLSLYIYIYIEREIHINIYIIIYIYRERERENYHVM